MIIVDINDDFFDLGGHSLAAVRLFSRIERQFDVRLSPAIILQAPTIAQLARFVRNDRPISDGHVLIPIQTAGHGTPFFLVHGIGGGLIGYRDLVNNLGKDRPIYGLQAIGLNNQDALDQSVEEMASHYIKAILSFQPKGPYLLGGYCFGGVIAYQMACQLEKLGEQVDFLALFEGILPAAIKQRVPFFKRVVVFLNSLPIWIKDYASMTIPAS